MKTIEEINQSKVKKIISERSNILQSLSLEKKRHFYETNLGKVKQVLIERWKKGILSGYSDNYIPSMISGKPNEVNKIITGPAFFLKVVVSSFHLAMWILIML